MTAYGECLAGVCPCSRPERPPEGHECPSDGLTYAEREEATERELHRPWADDPEHEVSVYL